MVEQRLAAKRRKRRKSCGLLNLNLKIFNAGEAQLTSLLKKLDWRLCAIPTARSRDYRKLKNRRCWLYRSDSSFVSCIRSYPKGSMSEDQFQACNKALLWCVRHWWEDPYQHLQRQYSTFETPRLPSIQASSISCEFITGIKTAVTWCEETRSRESVQIDRQPWEDRVTFAASMASQGQAANRPILNHHNHAIFGQSITGLETKRVVQ